MCDIVSLFITPIRSEKYSKKTRIEGRVGLLVCVLLCLILADTYEFRCICLCWLMYTQGVQLAMQEFSLRLKTALHLQHL